MIQDALLVIVELLIALPILPLEVCFFLFLLLVQFDLSGPNWVSQSAIGLHNAVKIVVLPFLLMLRTEGGNILQLRWRPNRLSVIWLALTSYAAIATIWSPLPLSAVKQVGYLASYFMFAVVALRLAKDHLETVERMVLPALYLSFAIALFQTYIAGNTFGAQAWRLTTFVGPKAFALWLVFCFVILLWLTARRAVHWRWTPLAGFLLGAALLLNNSRLEMGDVVLMAAVVAITGVCRGLGTVRRPLVFAGSAVLGMALAAGVVLFLSTAAGPSAPLAKVRGRLTEVPKALGADASSEAVSQVPVNMAFRLTRYRRALRELEKRSPVLWIFGAGTSSAVSVARVTEVARWKGDIRKLDPNRVVHNGFLRVLLEWGIVGLVLFIALGFEVGRLVWENARSRYPGQALLALGIIPLAVWLMLGNLLAASGDSSGVALVLWLALVVSTRRRAGAEGLAQAVSIAPRRI